MNDIIGTIFPPASIPSSAGDTTGFLTAIITFIIVLAGIFSLWQFIIAGLNYITAGGDKAKVEIAQTKINHALIGLVIIAMSFILSAITGKILFDDANFILSPKIETIN